MPKKKLPKKSKQRLLIDRIEKLDRFNMDFLRWIKFLDFKARDIYELEKKNPEAFEKLKESFKDTSKRFLGNIYLKFSWLIYNKIFITPINLVIYDILQNNESDFYEP